MDHLPVDIVGNILSRLEDPRHIVRASATCKIWQDAWRNHLHILTFDYNDMNELSTSAIQILITQMIFQTKGLQRLSLIMGELPAAPVIAWLMYTKENLRELDYNIATTPKINILEKCGRRKLEVLSIANNTITGVEMSSQKFPFLKSLSLTNIVIPVLDMRHLLTICPKLEMLTLENLYFDMPDSTVIIDLSCHSLKDIHVRDTDLDGFTLEADSLERLHLESCTIDVFKFIGKGTLRFLEIDDVSLIHFNIGENVENLEIVDVSGFTMMWAKFHHMISKSSKLRKLRLWEIVFDDEDEVVDMETIASCFPLLEHLSLDYYLKQAAVQNGLQGCFVFENVIFLEVGWMLSCEVFSIWVSGLLEKCPNLRKLLIHGVVSQTKTPEECNMLANFMVFTGKLMRKYVHMDIQFEFE